MYLKYQVDENAWRATQRYAPKICTRMFTAALFGIIKTKNSSVSNRNKIGK